MHYWKLITYDAIHIYWEWLEAEKGDFQFKNKDCLERQQDLKIRKPLEDAEQATW